MRKMTFQEKENAYTALVHETAAKQGMIFIEDSGEGRDMETETMYLEDIGGWLFPVGTPEQEQKDYKWYCFAEWELDGNQTPIVKFVQV